MVESMELAGQVAMVTGAGRGIGRAIAMTFAGAGAKVAVTGRNQQRRDRVSADIVSAGGEALAIPLDVTKDDQVSNAVSQLISHWGRIDILVNNAGIIVYDSPLWATDVPEWDEMMAVNLRGVFLCCRGVLPHMMERGQGLIINIGSAMVRRATGEDLGPYTASKWGVVGYTVSLARSLRSHGVRVNGINPGMVDTDMTRASNPSGDPKWTTPQEIAQTALFLATRAPKGMTGQFIDAFGI